MPRLSLPANAKRTVGKLQLAGCSVEEAGERVPGAGRRVSCSAIDRNPAYATEREPPVPPPLGDDFGIALHHAYPIRRQIQVVGDDLGIGRGVALPGGLGADQQMDVAVPIERKSCAVSGPDGATGFNIGRKTDATKFAGALLRRRRACRSPPTRPAPARAPWGAANSPVS